MNHQGLCSECLKIRSVHHHWLIYQKGRQSRVGLMIKEVGVNLSTGSQRRFLPIAKQFQAKASLNVSYRRDLRSKCTAFVNHIRPRGNHLELLSDDLRSYRGPLPSGLVVP